MLQLRRTTMLSNISTLKMLWKVCEAGLTQGSNNQYSWIRESEFQFMPHFPILLWLPITGAIPSKRLYTSQSTSFNFILPCSWTSLTFNHQRSSRPPIPIMSSVCPSTLQDTVVLRWRQFNQPWSFCDDANSFHSGSQSACATLLCEPCFEKYIETQVAITLFMRFSFI